MKSSNPGIGHKLEQSHPECFIMNSRIIIEGRAPFSQELNPMNLRFLSVLEKTRILYLKGIKNIEEIPADLANKEHLLWQQF